MINLSAEERDYLLDVLKATHAELLHELHHTETRAFEETLQQRVSLNEQLTRKLSESNA